MTQFFVLAMCLAGINPTTIKTGVYRGPYPQQIHVTDDHVVFVLDMDDGLVRVFNEDGALRQTIAQSGQGPGDVLKPTALTILDDILYICDLPSSKVVVYDTSGQFRQSFKAPRDVVKPFFNSRKARNGWLFKTKDDALVFSNDQFSEFQSISGVFDPDMPAFNPSERRSLLIGKDHLHFALDDSLTKVAYFAPAAMELIFYDLTSKVIYKKMKLEVPRVSYTDAQKEEKLAHTKELQTRMSHVSTQTEIAEFYPMVLMLRRTADNLLRLDRVINQAGGMQAYFYTFEGEPTSSWQTAIRSERLIKLTKEWAYIGYKEDDELILQRLPINELKSDVHLNQIK